MPYKAIFLDCDGTLIEDHGYINNPDQVMLLAGVTDALVELKAMGYKLIVVSNQSGVARGIVTEKVLAQIHNRLKNLLAEKNASLDRIYYCPYHPDGVVEKYRKESDNRKPAPGMLLTAAKKMNIDLNQSWMIGDSDRDIEAGSQAGCKTILINYSAHRRLEPPTSSPDYRAVNMKEAVNIIKQHHRGFAKALAQPQPPKKADSQPNTQSSQQHNASEPPQPKATSADQIPASRSEQLLISILDQLKGIRRAEIFDEFSLTKLIAGILQVIVLFCILITVWFLMSPTSRSNSVIIALGFAILLQLMALTFYIMQGRK
jgi:D-glycero-D-manno-heptose 1,7-bisphosphate phosphatase